jgi:hypothetical protein
MFMNYLQTTIKNKNEGGNTMKMKTRKIRENAKRIYQNTKTIVMNDSGDQFTSFLIVLLIVVVVGAGFMILYREGIQTIWNNVMNKISEIFGLGTF